MVRRRTSEAKRLAEKERYSEAIERYDEALDIKYSAEIVLKIAEIYFKMGEYEKGVEIYDSIHDKRNAALALIEVGRFDEAIEELEAVIDDPDMYLGRYRGNEKEKLRFLASTYNDMGWAYNMKEDYGKAIECYEKGIGYCHDFAGNWNCKAIALENQGNYPEALKFYNIALQIDVGDEIILKNKEDCLKSYGRAYLSGEYRVKSDYLRKALRMVREDSKDSGQNDEVAHVDEAADASDFQDEVAYVDDPVDVSDFQEEATYKHVTVFDFPVGVAYGDDPVDVSDRHDEMDFAEQTDFLKGVGKESLITIVPTSELDFERGMELRLVRENPESDAVAVCNGMVKVGYVAESENSCCSLTSKAGDVKIKEYGSAQYLFRYHDEYHVAWIYY